MKSIKWKGRKELFSIEPYSPGKSIENVKDKFKLNKIIKMASNENPLGASKKAIKYIKHNLNELNLYPDSESKILKIKIAEKNKLLPENIIIGNGSDELIRYIGESFLCSDNSIIIGDPSFPIHAFSGYLMGANVIKHRLENFQYNLNEILNLINKNSNVKIIYICNPNNPTGTIVKEKEIRSFINKISEEIIIVFDEAYKEYAGNEFFSALNLVRENKKNIIVLNTFSKIYGLAALRVGYASSCLELISFLKHVKDPFNVNHIAQVAAKKALEDIKHVKKSRYINEIGKNFLYKMFDNRNIKYYQTSANFIWVNVKKDSKIIFNELLKKGIIIRPGYLFNHPCFLRISIGTENQNKLFIKYFDKIFGKI